MVERGMIKDASVGGHEGDGALPSASSIQARLLENMTEGVSLTDENGTIVYTNPAEDAMFGYAPGELVGQHVSVQNAYPPEENERKVQAVIDELKSRGHWEGGWHNRRKDGSDFYTNSRISAVEMDGKTYFLCVQRDVTDVREREDRLRLYGSIFENAPSGIATIGLDGRYIEQNRSHELLTGFSDSDLEGATPAIHLGQEKFEEIARALAESGSWRGEVESTRKDGQKRILDLAAFSVRGPDGSPVCFVGMKRDITVQHEARRALEESERRHRRLFESSLDPIFVAKDGVYVDVNQAAADLLGYKREEMIGKGSRHFIASELTPSADQALAELRSKGEWSGEFPMLHADGHAVWMEYRSYMDPADGRIVGVARDVSERKRTQEALERRAAQQTALFTLTDRLSRAESLDEIHEASLDAILGAIACDRASILLFDPDEVMRFKAWRGLSDDYRRVTEGHTPWRPDTPDPEPIAMNDVATADLGPELQATIANEGIGALAFIPLVAKGLVIGKFMTYWNRPHEVTKEELDLALTIARQLAFAVDRRRSEAERLEAEKALREEQERFRIATRAGSVGVWDWDIEANRVAWTDSHYEMHGVSREEFDGTVESFARLVHPDDLQFVSEAIDRSLKEDAPYELEFRAVRPDNGGLAWLYTSATVVRDATGKPLHMIGATVDITDRKLQEEALRESEERLQIATDAAGMYAWEGDLKTRAVTWSTSAPSVIGCRPEDLPDNLTDAHFFLNPDESKRARQAFAEAISSRKDFFQLEFRGKGEPESAKHFFTQARLFYDSDGTPTKVVGVTQDITDRKRQERALGESEERFRALTSASSDVMYRVSADWAEMMPLDGRGLVASNDEPIRDWLLKNIPEDEHARIRAAYERAIADRAPFELEHKVYRPDRTIAWTYSRAVPILGADGEIVEWFGAASDVTEQKQAEETLRRSRETFETLVKNSPFGVYAVDSDFKLSMVGAGAQKVFENVHPLIGRDFAEVLREIWEEPFASEATKRFSHTLETGETYHAPDTVQKRADVDEVEAYDWKIERITMPDGRPGVVCHFYDLSERLKYEATLREQAEEITRLNTDLERRVKERTAELIAANREMEGFTYSVSHDLRGPLRAIVSTSRILLEDHAVALSSEARECLLRQATAANKLGTLIDDLLKLSRLGREEIAKRPINLSEMIRDVVEQAANDYNRQYALEVQTGLTVEADHRLLRLVITNLVENSFKFAKDSEPLRIEVKVDEEIGAVCFSDNGIGFDQRYAEKIFMPFERLHLDSEYPGTGVGLANVKRIIERHGGRVWAHGENGKGATFCFTLK